MEILIQNTISMLADEMWNAYIQTILSNFKRQDIIMLLVSGWPVVKISSFLYKHQHSKNQIFLHHEEFVDNLLPKISRIRYKLYACTCTGCPSKKSSFSKGTLFLGHLVYTLTCSTKDCYRIKLREWFKRIKKNNRIFY